MSAVLRRELLGVFTWLSSMVEPEGYPTNHWIRKFRYAKRILADTDLPDGDAIAEVRYIYKGLYSGGRGFDDFFLWREDEMERRLAAESCRFFEVGCGPYVAGIKAFG